MDRKKVLWISLLAPYDKVKHAGGKTHNYYIKQFAKDNRFELTLVTFAKKGEKEIVRDECEKNNINNKIVSYEGLHGLLWKIIDIETLNPYNRYASITPNSISHGVIKSLKLLKKEGYCPDVIIMEWTQITLLVDSVKRIFSQVPIAAIEVDVAYLGFQRRYNNATNILFKKIYGIRYKRLKHLELEALKKINLVAVNNDKDKKLLIEDGEFDGISRCLPYYQDFYDVIRAEEYNNTIIIYGAMDRPENWKSAIWFINNVMPLLDDLDITLLVVGANPVEELKKYENDRVHILGFIDDLRKEFSECMCMAVPLIEGAGIKVKVIEGLSAGIPVVSNKIGIEGIDAVDGRDYFYSETPQEFADSIRRIYFEEVDIKSVEKNARNLIKDEFDYRVDQQRFADKIMAL